MASTATFKFGLLISKSHGPTGGNPSVKSWMVRAPMVAHLRPANLRDFLVRAKLPEVDRRQGASRRLQPGFKKCGKARCLCCIYSTNSRTHTSTLTGQTCPIKQSITCEDSSVCYNVDCFALKQSEHSTVLCHQHGLAFLFSKPVFVCAISDVGRVRLNCF